MTDTAQLAADIQTAVLDQRIQAMRADREAGLVPADVTRPLFDHELTARTNFAAIDDHIAAQADYLARRAKADRARFLALVDQDLRATAARGGPESPLQRIALRLFDLDGPGGLAQIQGYDKVIADAELYHRGRLNVAAGGAARTVLQEAKAQGLPTPEDLAAKLDEIQADQLDLLARRLAQAPHVDVVRALRDQVVLEDKNFVTADELVDRLIAHGHGLSDGPLADLGRTAASQADAIGRVAAASTLPTPKAIYASEILDRNTCGPCSLIDGHEYSTITTARVDYPQGTYIRCEGGLRCRGTLVFVWPTEADPTLQEPGDNPAATIPPPTAGEQLVHPAARLHVPVVDQVAPAYEQVAREIGDALAVMGDLHQVPARSVAIPVALDPDLGDTKGANGMHSAYRGGHSVLIQVWTEADNPGFTFVHESGHYLDFEAFGQAGSFATHGAILGDVLAAIDASDAVAQFRRLALARPEFADEVESYWLDPRELWARAYSQWVAERSGDARLIASARGIAEQGPMQWSQADFEAIGRAIDTAMAPLGFTP